MSTSVSSSSASPGSAVSLRSSHPVVVVRRTVTTTWAIVGLAAGAIIGFVVASVLGLILGAVVFALALGFVGDLLVRRVVESALDVVGSELSSHNLATKEMESGDSPRLFNLLSGLCATTGVGMPRVFVVEDSGINAMVMADPLREQPAILVVTRGFLERLERIEMEGAVAVCLSRLRSGLAEVQTLAAALRAMSPWFVPARVRNRVYESATSAQAVFDADVKGVGITRYPPGLAAAFVRMLAESTQVSGVAAVVVPLWLADPRGESDVSWNSASVESNGSRVDGSGDERPSLSERLALLTEI